MVVAVGMMTAVGLTAAETAASVDAGTAGFTESAMLDQHFDPFTLAEVIDDGLPGLAEEVPDVKSLASRESRMLSLATMPLRECLAGMTKSEQTPSLCLALPESQTRLPLDAVKFLERLTGQTEAAFESNGSECTRQGRAGGLLAVGDACAKIAKGESKFVIAGGVDTYRDPYVLGTLDMQKRVKLVQNMDGFIPGEGAAFLLLSSRDAVREFGLAPLARLSPVTEGFEEGHLASEEPYKGEGLAETLEKLFEENDVEEAIRDVYSSMNGENHWAKEWGVAFTRNGAHFDPDHQIHHPADCFGDTGAACGLLLTGLAALDVAQGNGHGPAVVYCSSDYGPRAALAVLSP